MNIGRIEETHSILSKFIQLSLAAVLVFLGSVHAEQSKAERIVGVKLYEYKKDFGRLFSQWKILGVNNAYVSVDLARNQEFRRLAKAGGVSTWIILPVFYNPEKLKQDPDLYAVMASGKKAEKDWVQFVCPSRIEYCSERLAFVRELVKECQPDGLSIDFIRFFVYWEAIYPATQPDPSENTCFCSHCLRNFQMYAHLEIPSQLNSVQEASHWILKNHLREWGEWKCHIVTSMVASIAQEARKVNPGIRLNLHLVPWRENDFDQSWKTVAGQDPTAISPYVDTLSPMCYAYMVRQDSAWIHSVARDLQSRASKPILVSIQVSDEGKDQIAPGLFKQYLEQAIKSPSIGVVFWNWEMLDKNPEKQQIVKAVLTGLQRNRE